MDECRMNSMNSQYINSKISLSKFNKPQLKLKLHSGKQKAIKQTSREVTSKTRQTSRDCIEEKSFKSENFDSNLQDEPIDDTADEKKRCENEIKKLNFWDFQHVQTSNNNIISYAKQNEITSINWMLEMKDQPQQINLIKRNKYLGEFFKKMEEEQRTIFLQSMNINKKNFKFDVFETQFNASSDKEKEFLSRHANVDYYREVMKEKLKLEDILKKDLLSKSQLLYNKKIEKHNLIDSQMSLADEIINLQNEMMINRKAVESEKQELKKELEKLDGPKVMNLDESKNSSAVKKVNCEEAFMIRSKLLTEANEKQQQFAKIVIAYDKKKISIENKIQQNNLRLQDVENAMSILKSDVNRLIKEHRSYYFDILKKGIDVRHEGLSWVIRKLIALNAYFDYSAFPRFFDHNQIDYLLELSYKQTECNHLKTVLKVLKNKQNEAREEMKQRSGVRNNTNRQPMLSTSNFFEYNSRNEEKTSKPCVNSYEDNIKKMLDEITKKYENMSLSDIHQNQEDLHINGIVQVLKNKLKQYLLEEKDKDKDKDDIYENLDLIDGLYFLPNSLAQFFKENKKYREYFEDIFFLRDEIVKMENEIEQMKSSEMKMFKRMYESSRYAKNSVEYEMIYSAMFGNGIII